jgi:hypothetical protein
MRDYIRPISQAIIKKYLKQLVLPVSNHYAPQEKQSQLTNMLSINNCSLKNPVMTSYMWTTKLARL